ncbi:hypothetical protein BGZ80_009681 [Entomortierella chlamydospora]|uniref:Uncharacterized protein n=1 Tax=Entomortierella chlamydospora TaxID=101097 RepID=A0A9P6MVZ1_9FUNG|nr:hypothetical protein BGZ80_009681 [Entomortierella chlamydospora]
MHAAVQLANIPHLVDLVCDNLITRDIYRSTIVCRDFYLGFSRNIFNSINIQWRATFNKLTRHDTLKALSSQTGNIHSVSTTFAEIFRVFVQAALPNPCPVPYPAIDPTAFHRLRTLKYIYPKESSYPKLLKNHKYLPSILSVIESSPNLESLHLGFFLFKEPDYIQRLMSAIRKKGRCLQELHFASEEYVGSEILRELLWSCAAVRRLDLSVRYYDLYRNLIGPKEARHLDKLAKEALSIGDGCKTEDIVFQWRQLVLPCDRSDYGVLALVPVLRHCSLLEELKVPMVGARYYSKLLQHFSPSVLPKLCRVDFRYLSMFIPDLESSSSPNTYSILHSFGSLQSVVAWNSISTRRSGVFADWLISNCFSTLERLNISGCSQFRSPHLQRILCGCPMLKEVDALNKDRRPNRGFDLTWPLLDLYDIKDSKEEGDGEWACLGLEVLQLCYTERGATVAIPAALYKQISRLKRIQVLRLMNAGTIGCGDNMIIIKEERDSVRKAVKEWSCLSDLRELRLLGLKPYVPEEYIKERRKQWAKLERLYYD